MGCSAYDVENYIKGMCIPGDIYKDLKFKPTHPLYRAKPFSSDPTIRLCDFNEKNNSLYSQILQENDRLVPLLKAKLDELRMREYSQIIMIGKAICGKPCYAYNRTLFTRCPECNGAVKDKPENGTYEKQVYDEDKGAYKWETFYNEDNICLNYTFNDKVDKWDYDLDSLEEFFDKEDKEKTVHWSYIDGNETKEKDMPIHYMMLEGERFEFPFGLHMKEFLIMNDGLLFPLQGNGWKSNGFSFSIIDQDTLHYKIGAAIGYYGVACLRFIMLFECTSCRLQYHIIRTTPFMARDKSKDPK